MSTTPGGAQKPLSPSAAKVQEAIAALGLVNRVIELPKPVRTAAEAAAAVGCDVRQIAKSIIFMTASTKRPVLVVTSGANRVNEQTLATLVGEPLARAPASFVREQTGFAIGGVPPLGHRQRVETFLDLDLMGLQEIWAAAGHPNALFRVTPEELLLMSSGRVVSVT
jgi:prolyl-tRNA editing enzyme YbaK/EbsC (Cys-tRNA(Pro) deacylase)